MTPLRIGVVAGVVAVCIVVLLTGCEASHTSANTIVIIDSKPVQGADVSINGEPTGQTTPATFNGLPPERLLVEVAKEGFKKSWRNVTPIEGQEQRVVMELEPQVAYLSVDSQPRGAQVVLDNGKVLGETPITRVPIQIGKRTYTVSIENYQPVSKAIDAQEFFPYSYTHQLQPLPAHLEIVSRPSGASVFINEEAQNKTAPVTIDLTPGTYTVGVKMHGYVDQEETVAVGPNEKRSLVLSMTAGEVPPGMVLVPEGEFIMGFDKGAPDELPQRKVTIPAFYIDKFEVTNAEFKTVFANHAFESGKENSPVSDVTWEEADAYARAIGKRLPTEEEWEKAARGTDGREYPWGNNFDPALCNSAEKTTLGVEDVGKYRAGVSPYGCMDMAGNVWEWTASWYNAYPGNTSIEKDYGQIFRVLRGGSYQSNKYDVRCASRNYDRMKSAKSDYGFRCAKDVPVERRK